MFRQGKGQHALVWRQGFKPGVRALGKAEFRLVAALETGLSLDVAVNHASNIEPAFDLNTWLAQAVQTDLVTGAVHQPN